MKERVSMVGMSKFFPKEMLINQDCKRFQPIQIPFKLLRVILASILVKLQFKIKVKESLTRDRNQMQTTYL